MYFCSILVSTAVLFDYILSILSTLVSNRLLIDCNVQATLFPCARYVMFLFTMILCFFCISNQAQLSSNVSSGVLVNNCSGFLTVFMYKFPPGKRSPNQDVCSVDGHDGLLELTYLFSTVGPPHGVGVQRVSYEFKS